MSTPLAYMWSRTDLSRYVWTGLLRPGRAGERSGLMLLRPYEPDKIPIVMVHGLASSPLAWIPMLNELLRDPKIHDKYQFLLYVYPTGVPIQIAAVGLRDSISQAEVAFGRSTADPTQINPAFGRMVLLGHSMGGLLSHAMSLHSGNKFWELNSDRRFEDIVGPPKVLDELRARSTSSTRFRPSSALCSSRRRITARSTAAVRSAGSVRASSASPTTSGKLLTHARRRTIPTPSSGRRFPRRLPTSIDTLDPDSDVLRQGPS